MIELAGCKTLEQASVSPQQTPLRNVPRVVLILIATQQHLINCAIDCRTISPQLGLDAAN